MNLRSDLAKSAPPRLGARSQALARRASIDESTVKRDPAEVLRFLHFAVEERAARRWHYLSLFCFVLYVMLYLVVLGLQKDAGEQHLPPDLAYTVFLVFFDLRSGWWLFSFMASFSASLETKLSPTGNTLWPHRSSSCVWTYLRRVETRSIADGPDNRRRI